MKDNHGRIFLLIVCAVIIPLLLGCHNPAAQGSIPESGAGFTIKPKTPDLKNYDVIFIGENHISSQNFGIELGLMQYYYSLGVRDFALECSFSDALFFQYYFDTGDEDCYEFINRYSAAKRITIFNKGKAEFYKKIYQWNSTLEEKIRVHGFDIEHDPYGAGVDALWFFILKNYDQIEGIPLFSGDGIWQRAGNWYRLIEDFRTNQARYSNISAPDMELMKKIIANVEQGLLANNWNFKLSQKENQKRIAILREQFMAENFRKIREDTGDAKVFAIMGYNHSALNGKAIYTVNESQFPSVSTSEPSMAAVLKNEMNIASIVLRTFGNSSKWPFIVKIKGWQLSEPNKSVYKGKWPLD
ncbi:MAG: hypothetical protein FWD78_07785 [Treponema sp.]|nr:hypothetical protein [Treponema sp.]